MSIKTFALSQKNGIFGPKMTDIAPKYEFLAVLEQIQVLPAPFVPCWLVGCWARAALTLERLPTLFVYLYF